MTSRIILGLWILPVLAALASAQLPGEIKGHAGFVHHLAFSPDGNIMATASLDKTVKIWDAKTGKELKTLKGHTDQVYCVAVNNDGSMVASGSRDKSIRLWDVKEAKVLKELKGHTESVESVAFSPDGKLLASGGLDKAVRLWDASDGRELKNLGTHPDSVYCVAWSPDGTLLASAGREGTIKIWDVKAKKELRLLAIKDSKDGVVQVVFGADNKTLYAGGFDKFLHVWDVAAGRQIRTLGPMPDNLFGLAISRDGAAVAAAAYDGNVRVWNVKTGEAKDVQLQDGKKRTMITFCIAFAPDGKSVVTGHEAHNAVRVTPLEKFAAVVEERRVEEKKAIGGLLPSELRGHAGIVHHLAFSPDGSMLATASFDKTIKIWDAETGKELSTLKGHTDHVYCVAFSSDSAMLASGGKDRSIRLWNVKEGKTIKELKGHTASVDSVAFNPNGKVLASGSADTSVRLWNLDAGTEIGKLGEHGDRVNWVAWSPHGLSLASAGDDGSIKIWDGAAKVVLKSMAVKGSKDGVLQVDFAPDKKVLYACGPDKCVHVWDLGTGTEASRLGPLPDAPFGLAVSPDGKTVAAASHDGHLLLWNTQNGESRAFQLRDGKRSVVTYCIAFTPDGSAVVTGHEADNAVRVTPIDKFVKAAAVPKP
jgi:WD40 repeat protein